MSKRPAFQFYPGDWRTDPGLRLCSVAARGLWIEMMAIMHEGDPYGHLTVQGRPISHDMLARLVGEGAAAVKRLLKELEVNDVFSVTGDGVLYSRRMVRDEAIREARAAGGALGGEHGVKGAGHGRKGGRPRKEKPPFGDAIRGDILPPPSSSSPSSSPDIDDDGEAGARDFDGTGPPDLAELTDQLARTAGVRHIEPGQIGRNVDCVREWLALGATPQELATIIARAVAGAGTPIHSLRYFDGAVRQAVARRENRANGTDHDDAAAAEIDDPLVRAAAARAAARRGGGQREHI